MTAERKPRELIIRAMAHGTPDEYEAANAVATQEERRAAFVEAMMRVAAAVARTHVNEAWAREAAL